MNSLKKGKRMNKSLKGLALIGALVVGSAQATEFRSPWIAEQGPLRYNFEKLNKDKFNFNAWTAFHMKEAHKAFMKHGTDTKPMAELIFGASEFTLADAMPGGQVPFGVEEYSPYLRLSKITPQVEYMEYGVTVGARWDYPVWKEKGRIGIRASVPFRRIEMERKDFSDKNADPSTEFVASEVISINRNSPRFDIDIAGAAETVTNSLPKAANDAGNEQAAVDAVLNTAAGTSGKTDAVNKVWLQLTSGATNVTKAANTFDTSKNAGVVADISPVKTIDAKIGEIIATTNDNTGVTLAQGYDATLAQVAAARIAKIAVAGNMDKAAIVAQLKNTNATTGANVLLNAVANRGDRAVDTLATDIVCSAYRLDFVQSLENSSHQSAVQFVPVATDGDKKHVYMFGNDVCLPDAQRNRATVAITKADDAAAMRVDGYVAWMAGPDGHNPQYWIEPTTTNISKASTDLSQLPEKQTLATFQTGNSYDIDFKAQKANAAQAWITFRRAADSADPDRFARQPSNDPGVGSTIARNIENLMRIYKENPYQFLNRKDYDFDTQIRSGLGDIPVELFYEHTFNKEWMGELMVGVKFPTGGDKDQYANPYKAILGNGEHFELLVGGLVAWQPIKWMNIKVDGRVSFVLEDTENRMAAFGALNGTTSPVATIKNVGPMVKADVDWTYFTAHIDFTFFHPKNSDIRTSVGYEFYYKTEDHLTFKEKTMTSWLGGIWNDTTKQYDDNPQPLSNALARKNTESIAHKFRGETSLQINKYFELYAGAATTFAGKNLFADRDAHLGFNIRF